VEDVVQCVFMKALTNKQSFNEKAKHFTWLYRIAVNECLNYIKKNRNIYEKYNEKEWFHNSQGLFSDIDKRILYKYLINGFDEKERKIILLYIIEGIPISDVAIIIGVSRQAVHKKWNKIKVSLQNHIRDIL
jgi:RNA polymerase sigma-70 factor (ECF subfamily)